MAVGVHVLLIWGVQQSVAATGEWDWDTGLVAPLVPSSEPPVAVPMQYRAIGLAPRSGRATTQPTPSAAAIAARARAVAVGPTVAPAPARDSAVARVEAVVPPAAAPRPAPARTQLRPAYGSGRLWVRPLPMSPREMASVVTGKSPAQVADSVVALVVQQYLDAIAAERADPANRPPSWTTNIAGQKVGVDGQWIYIGPLKLPTALLALLPINLQGNPTQAEMNKRFSAMREDLFFAARRAATLEEFKKNVAILRQQKQYEHDLRRAQRTLPDSVRP